MKPEITPVLIAPSSKNIEELFSKIEAFAAQKGYRIIGQLKLPTNLLGFTKEVKLNSKSQMKDVRSALMKVDKHMTVGRVNRFLHMLYKHVLDSKDPAPKVDYSEKECQIKAARKAYKKADAETLKLLKAYKEIKGDFYKKK